MRTNCKLCKYSKICTLTKTEKMYQRRCYIDEILNKMNISPQLLMRKFYNFSEKYGIGLPTIEEIDWISFSNKERQEYIKTYLEWFIRKDTNKLYDKADGELCITVLNTIYDGWRDKEVIRCARCGQYFPNSKQKNAIYCQDCKGYQSKRQIQKICVDCGESFFFDGNRSCRCWNCAKRHNKEMTKLRVQRYRNKKKM